MDKDFVWIETDFISKRFGCQKTEIIFLTNENRKKINTRLCLTGYKKVINWELYKRLKFDHTDKWYRHKAEPVQENEMQKILWSFKIQMDQQPIPDRR